MSCIIDISIHSDITIERYYRRHDNLNCDVSPYTGKVTARMSRQYRIALQPIHSNSDCHLSARQSNPDWRQFSPMSSCHSIKSKRSCANLTQRLLQLTCIILCSLLRLITSDKSSSRFRDIFSLNKPCHPVIIGNDYTIW